MIVSIFIILALLFPIVQTIVLIRTQEAETLQTPEEHYEAGLGYLDEEEYNYAFYEFNQAIEGDPDYLDAYFEIGKIYLMAGEPSTASAAFSFVIQRDSEHAEAFYYRALSYLTIDDLINQARTETEESVEFDSIIEPPLLLNLTDILATDVQEEIFTLEEGGSSDEVPAFIYNRGLAYYNMDEFGKAIVDQSRVIDINPEFLDAYYQRGLACFQEDQYESAIEDWAYVIEQYPEYAQAYYSTGLAYYFQEEYEAAIDYFSQAIEVDPDYGHAYYFRGNVNIALQDFDPAIEDYTKAISLDTELGQSYYNRAVSYYRRGYESKAIMDFQMVLEVSEDAELIERTEGILRSFGVTP